MQRKGKKKEKKKRSTAFLHWNVLPAQHTEKVKGHWTNVSLFCSETVSADLGTQRIPLIARSYAANRVLCYHLNTTIHFYREIPLN